MVTIDDTLMDDELFEERYDTYLEIKDLRRDIDVLGLPNATIWELDKKIKAKQIYLDDLEAEILRRGDCLSRLEW